VVKSQRVLGISVLGRKARRPSIGRLLQPVELDRLIRGDPLTNLAGHAEQPGPDAREPQGDAGAALDEELRHGRDPPPVVHEPERADRGAADEHRGHPSRFFPAVRPGGQPVGTSGRKVPGQERCRILPSPPGRSDCPSRALDVVGQQLPELGR
jgi:hypothetical protein